METTTIKKQTAFRLDSRLLNELKAGAKREHRSLNNYVECLLMQIIYNKPNTITMAAINEAKSTENKETYDTVEDLMKELLK